MILTDYFVQENEGLYRVIILEKNEGIRYRKVIEYSDCYVITNKSIRVDRGKNNPFFHFLKKNQKENEEEPNFWKLRQNTCTFSYHINDKRRFISEDWEIRACLHQLGLNGSIKKR